MIKATAQFISKQVGSCEAGTVENSNQTFSEEVASGGTLSLPDTTINVFINGNLNQSETAPAMIDLDINIG